MTMPQAIRSAFARWSTFSGHAGGTEYWWFVLFGTIVFGLASLLDHAAFGRDALFGAICTLVFLMPYLAVAVRRLRPRRVNSGRAGRRVRHEGCDAAS
jgi:uncharacterized membrane protein YhaH (DUF805 family)